MLTKTFPDSSVRRSTFERTAFNLSLISLFETELSKESDAVGKLPALANSYQNTSVSRSGDKADSAIADILLSFVSSTLTRSMLDAKRAIMASRRCEGLSSFNSSIHVLSDTLRPSFLS